MKLFRTIGKPGIIAILVFSMTLLAGCTKNNNENQQTGSIEQSIQAGKYTFTDDMKNTVTVENPKKVAVLTGSYAHVWSLAGGKVSVVTDDAYDQTGLTLNDDVISVGQIKNPNSELLINSGADFVILSANIPAHIELAELMKKLNIPYAYFNVETFDDYLNMLEICTKITGQEALYKENGLEIKEDIENTIKIKKDKKSPKVLLVRAYSTGIKAKNSNDNMTGAMLKELGCINIADSDNSLLEDISIEKIIQEDPDFIFVTTMGNEEKALETVAEKLTKNPAWATLSAVKNDRYVVLDKTLFHEKPNNRWGESYEILANILYEQKK